MKHRLISWASRMFARWNTQPRLTAITFHRFGPSTGITRDLVRHHLAFLKQHNKFTLARDLIESPHQPCAMATVDDCHRDIYETLYPVARELGVPIVICVPTDFFLRQKWLWFDKCAWMMDRLRTSTTVQVAGRSYVLEPGKSPKALKEYCKRQQPDVRDAAVNAIAEQLGMEVPPSPVDGYESITFPQMREMLASGLVEISAHTVSHTIASVLSPERLEIELRDSKRELEEFAAMEIGSFCYPNGTVGDFNAATTAAVKRAGFRLAMTSVAGINTLPLNLFELKRIHAHAVPSVFEKDASGLGALQVPFRGDAHA